MRKKQRRELKGTKRKGDEKRLEGKLKRERNRISVTEEEKRQIVFGKYRELGEHASLPGAAAFCLANLVV